MKIKHIKKSSVFADIIKNGEKVKEKSIALYFFKRTDEAIPQIGVVISKKAVQKAVTRNYIRRLIYAYFINESEISDKNVKLIFRITRSLRGITRKPLSQTIRKELGILINKAKI